MYCKFYTIENGSGLNMKRIIALMLAIACFAGGFWETTAQETPETETLEIQYTDSNGNSRTLQVEKDVKVLRFRNLKSLTLPDGLTKLHSLEIDIHDGSAFVLQSLKLPKDIGKDADWPFRVVLGREISSLSVHKDMGPFLLIYRKRFGGEGSFSLPTRIPSAKELIKDRTPESDGVFRIEAGNSLLGASVIEVHGVPPRIWLNRQEGGVEIVWEAGPLQSAPTINGPWKDITFDDTRRLFLRSSSPAEFFRVKPMAEDESPTETQQSTPSKTSRQTPHFLL